MNGQLLLLQKIIFRGISDQDRDLVPAAMYSKLIRISHPSPTTLICVHPVFQNRIFINVHMTRYSLTCLMSSRPLLLPCPTLETHSVG